MSDRLREARNKGLEDAMRAVAALPLHGGYRGTDLVSRSDVLRALLSVSECLAEPEPELDAAVLRVVDDAAALGVIGAREVARKLRKLREYAEADPWARIESRPASRSEG